jgi:hypothetical protein
LEETMEKIQKIFETEKSNNSEKNNEDSNTSGINMNNLPSPDDIQNHISGMLNGKLGDLAKELAEETAQGLNLDMQRMYFKTYSRILVN